MAYLHRRAGLSLHILELAISAKALRLSIGAGLLACASVAVAAAPVDVFIAKTVITMDQAGSKASAVAVENGRILAVGSLAQVKQRLGERRYRIDDSFRDKVLMPGFIDPHQHAMAAALTASLPNLAYSQTLLPDGSLSPGLKSRTEVMEKLKQYDQGMQDKTSLLLAWGFDPVAQGGHLTRAELDRISSRRSILVWDASIHNIYVNSAFIAAHQLDKAPRRPGVGSDARGELNGQFLGNNNSHPILFPLLAHYFQPEGFRKLLSSGIDLYRWGGITTIGELGFGGLDSTLEESQLAALYNDPEVPMRAVAVLYEPAYLKRLGSEQAVIEHALALKKRSTGKMVFNGIKFMSDDAFLSLTMRARYLDGHEGLWLTAPGEQYRRMLPWWKAGFQIHVHSNGEQSQEQVLDVLGRLQQAYPRQDHRFTFEHYGLSTAEQSRRLRKLGALASVNPWYVYLRGELNERHLGQRRAHQSSRLKTLLEQGVVTALHTDTPVASPLPLASAWVAINRLGQSGKVLAPEERISLDQALRMITIDAAYVLGMEQRIGSIEVGKQADFTVLERNPYQVSLEALRDVPIWGTVFGGRKFPLPRKAR